MDLGAASPSGLAELAGEAVVRGELATGATSLASSW